MRSASAMLDTLCAITIFALFGASSLSALRNLKSVVASSAEKESSNRSISGRRHERTRDGESLALTARKVVAALSDRRIEPVFQTFHEVGYLSGGKRRAHLPLGRTRKAVAQVVRGSSL